MRIGIAAVALLSLPALAQGEEAKPWGSRDFTFRRVAVGASPRLVQIDPTEEQYHLTPQRPWDAPRQGRADPTQIDQKAFDWFWRGVSPAITAASPNRLPRALEQLSLSERSHAPGWKTVSRIVAEYGEDLSKATQGTRVSPAFALSIMIAESAGREKAVSSAGAMGLMQLMPATAARFGVSAPFEPAENIRGGVTYLDFLLKSFEDDPILAAAAYNAGEGAVAEHEGVPPYRETRGYVPKVLAAWQVARMFCLTPPERATDPCVFSAGLAQADPSD